MSISLLESFFLYYDKICYQRLSFDSISDAFFLAALTSIEERESSNITRCNLIDGKKQSLGMQAYVF